MILKIDNELYLIIGWFVRKKSAPSPVKEVKIAIFNNKKVHIWFYEDKSIKISDFVEPNSGWFDYYDRKL